jgi:hypothetical protein
VVALGFAKFGLEGFGWTDPMFAMYDIVMKYKGINEFDIPIDFRLFFFNNFSFVLEEFNSHIDKYSQQIRLLNCLLIDGGVLLFLLCNEMGSICC